MEDQILLAGATGDLGGRIAKALISKGAKVNAIVRVDSKKEAVDILKAGSVETIELDINDHAALVQACKGATCIVSAFAGVRDVIVDGQLKLLAAAVDAGVPRFIPSDYSTDFTKLPDGENRNFEQSMYIHSMFSAHNEVLDNDRYRALIWSKLEEYIKPSQR